MPKFSVVMFISKTYEVEADDPEGAEEEARWRYEQDREASKPEYACEEEEFDDPSVDEMGD